MRQWYQFRSIILIFGGRLNDSLFIRGLRLGKTTAHPSSDEHRCKTSRRKKRAKWKYYIMERRVEIPPGRVTHTANGPVHKGGDHQGSAALGDAHCTRRLKLLDLVYERMCCLKGVFSVRSTGTELGPVLPVAMAGKTERGSGSSSLPFFSGGVEKIFFGHRPVHAVLIAGAPPQLARLRGAI